MNRLANLNQQISINPTAEKKYRELRPADKTQWFKLNGWGYQDTEFKILPDNSLVLTGNRYKFAGKKMPKFKEWAEKVVGLDFSIETPAQV